MTRAVLIALAVCCAMSPGGATAVQDTLPDRSVAKVGEEPISERDFDRWLRTAARGQGSGPVDPPRFRRCVATERRQQANDRRKLNRPALRRRCRRRYKPLKAEVMQFLIQAAWVQQEARAQGITVTAKKVRRDFQLQKRQAFETERKYRRFLRHSGLTTADILFRVRLDILQSRLTERAAAAAVPVTEDDVDAYYAKHRRRFRGAPRAEAERSIRRLLMAEREQAAIDDFIRDFRSRYRATTVCGEDYLVPECSNAPPE